MEKQKVALVRAAFFKNVDAALTSSTRLESGGAVRQKRKQYTNENKIVPSRNKIRSSGRRWSWGEDYKNLISGTVRCDF